MQKYMKKYEGIKRASKKEPVEDPKGYSGVSRLNLRIDPPDPCNTFQGTLPHFLFS